MHVHEWWQIFLQQIKETDIWQWIAVVLGVMEVLWAKAGKIWLYPSGIISTAITIWILFQSGLYAESFLNVYYVVMSAYGWWYWAKKKNLPPVKASWCTKKDWMITIGITCFGMIFLYLLLSRFTPSTVPLWDSWVSATAWAGMWLLAKRKIENWLLLNLSNLFAIPLLFYKELPLYALLTVFLFVVAIFGYLDWAKQYRKERGAYS